METSAYKDSDVLIDFAQIPSFVNLSNFLMILESTLLDSFVTKPASVPLFSLK